MFPIMTPERLKITLKNPNPLFEKWLERWLKEAESRNSKSAFTIKEALQSLRSYPLPLSSGRECGILRGFGSKLCSLIDKELTALKQGNILNSIPNFQNEVEQIVEKVKKSRKLPQPKPIKLTKKAQKAMEEEKERTKAITMAPRKFKIILLVDTQETSGKNKKTLDQTRSYLESLSVEYEVRRLSIGDFVWIAKDSEGNELVLPYICERKRMDDLASSIRDGRFHEQKHRLKQCGLQQIIYLIEDYGDNQHIGLPLENLQQAISNTQIHSGFQIAKTNNHWRSMVYLKGITSSLQRMFENKYLMSENKSNLSKFQPCDEVVSLMKFKSLNEDSAKNSSLNVKEVFVQQLLQLHSLSLDKALAIVSLYPTPRYLIDAYQNCQNESEARRLLSNIDAGNGITNRPIGDKISQQLYDFYCTMF